MFASAIVAATAFSCRPEPGLGSVALARHGGLHVIDLATCRDQVSGGGGGRREVRFGSDGRAHLLPSQTGLHVETRDGEMSADVRATGSGKLAMQKIFVTDRRTGAKRAVFSETQAYKAIGPGETPGPIMLLGLSGDRRWVFFTIDPGGSASIAADGLTLRAVSTTGGRAFRIARMLPYPDYLVWCGGRLVFIAGQWRVATDRKRLFTASPPNWRPHPLGPGRNRSWGSLACVPSSGWLVAQSQRQSSNPRFFSTHWALWRVGLDGSARPLTSPPPGFADESPRFSRNGATVLFVRSRKETGRLYALRGKHLRGPILTLGNSLGYYGHHDWWFSADWSAGS